MNAKHYKQTRSAFKRDLAFAIKSHFKDELDSTEEGNKLDEAMLEFCEWFYKGFDEYDIDQYNFVPDYDDSDNIDGEFFSCP